MEKNEKSLEALTTEYADLEKLRYRLEMKIKNLEHNVACCAPDEFDSLMYELEMTREQITRIAPGYIKTRCELSKMEWGIR